LLFFQLVVSAMNVLYSESRTAGFVADLRAFILPAVID
jgi:hypothetical protein